MDTEDEILKRFKERNVTNPNKYGRATKCTEENMEIVCAAVEAGLPLSSAVTPLPVSYATVARWLLEGEAHDKECQFDPDDCNDAKCGNQAAYRMAYRSIKRAQAARKLKLLQFIDKAAKDPARWQAAAWQLERGFPDEFALYNVDRGSKGTQAKITVNFGTERKKLMQQVVSEQAKLEGVVETEERDGVFITVKDGDDPSE